MSDQGYTPTTEKVRSGYVRESAGPFVRPNVGGRYAAEFDRWLAEVRREAAVKALREAHADLVAYTDSSAPFGSGRLEDFLLRRADEIEKGASNG